MLINYEWSDIMSDFELYKEELLKEGEERGRRERDESAILKMIKALRKLSLTDSPDLQILESRNESYGSIFSSSQLEEMLKSVE